MTEPVVLAAASAALLLFTAYLAAVETVVSRCNVVRALRLVEDEDDRSSRALLWLTEHRSSALDGLLAATVLARVALVVVAVALADRLVGGMGGWVGAAVGVVVASLVVGEVAPRTVALRHLERVGLALAPSARLLVRGVHPLARLTVAAGRGLVPRRHEVSGPHASDDELRALDDDDQQPDEELEPEERAMIRSIFELPDTLVREIMQPRPDMVTVSSELPLDAVVATAVEHGYSRLPVHDPDDADRIVGVVYAKDLLRQLATEPERRTWRGLMRQPTYVPEIKRVDELLRELQADRVHLALVVDEYGELVGLVTIEDILEEIVGEILDEHDQEEPLVESLEGDRLRVDARLGVDDLNELLGTDLPEEGWDTVGGLVFATLGRVPVEGERLELDGSVLTVESVQGRRVGKVVIEPGHPVVVDDSPVVEPVAADVEHDDPGGGAGGPMQR